MAKNTPTYRQREPNPGAGQTPAGSVDAEGEKDKEFSRGAGEPLTTYTNYEDD